VKGSHSKRIGFSVFSVVIMLLFMNIRPDVYAQCHVAIQAVHSDVSCLESTSRVVWTDLANTSFDGTSLNKTGGGNNWNAGAGSVTSIGYGGSIYLIVQSNNTERMFGLSVSNSGNDQNSIRHAFHLRANGQFRIRELNINRGDFGNYNIGDTLKLGHTSNGVKFYRNSQLLYVSRQVPVPTLITDVSFRNDPSSLGPITIVNPNNGDFSFETLGNGSGSSYEWFINGVSTGINNEALSLLTPQDGDVITCLLTPGAGSCFGSDIITQDYTLQNRSIPKPEEFYISETSMGEGCFEYREDVLWDPSEFRNLISTGNGLRKITGGSDWNGGAFSINPVKNNGYFEFIVTETNRRRMIGLSSANLNSDWNSIGFTFYLEQNGNLGIRESGINRGTFGNYSTGDTLRISIENSVIHYYRNGNLLRVGGTTMTQLFVDVSIRDIPGTIGASYIVNRGEGILTAVAQNAGPSPTYQWRRNGIQVGTNSSTYDGPALNDSDIITCELNRDASSCISTTYTSNQIEIRELPSPPISDIFISSDVTSVACQRVTEQVVWDPNSIQNGHFANGVFTKIQGNGQWNTGAASFNQVGEGGSMQVVASEANRRRMIGLSDTNIDANFNTIDFAFYLRQNGELSIYENGNNRGTFGTYTTGDTLRISIENSTVIYFKNSNPVRVSPVAPNLPLILDVSMRDNGATLSNVTVTNFSEGSFTALTQNVGTTPIYQWRLNGMAVGINSPNYVNTNISDGDQLICEVTPDIGGCNGVVFSSNVIEVSTVTEPNEINFYITGNVVAASCQQISEEVVWDINSLENIRTTGNRLEKIQSNGQWNGGAASLNEVNDNGYLQVIATETNRRRMIGLSDNNINSNFNTIDFAIYLRQNGVIGIYENGNNRGDYGNYNTGDTLRVAVENSVVYYYRNGNILRISPNAPVLPLIADVSIRDTGGTLDNVTVTNNNDGNFTAFSTNAGPSPVYQWRLNGNPVGTNSTTYSNPSIAAGDVLTCELTPDLGGCATINYVSNSIEPQEIPELPSVSFYVASQRVTEACQEAREEVVWDLNSLQNLDWDRNNLTKIQGNGQWNGGASSINTVVNDGSLEFIANETNRRRMIGLSDVDINSNFNTIDFAIYLRNNGVVGIYESGNNRGDYGSYTSGDTLRITVENNTIHYYKNQQLLRISPTNPILPLIVDVSIRDNGGTVTNATVTNPSGGSYTAFATNVGPSPSYQWFLNGSPVGTDSDMYVNPGIQAGDVITCRLSPDLGGCSATTYNSNSIILLEEPQLGSISPVITNDQVAAGYAFAEEDVVWVPATLENVTANRNSLVKVQSNGQWDGGAASYNTIYENGYVEFTTNENNRRKMVGISNSNANSHFNTISYAFSMEGNGTIRIYENGNNRGNFGTYSPGDRMRIEYSGGNIEYSRNGAILRTVAAGATSYLVDVSIRDVNATVTQAIVGNVSEGNFSLTSIGAGVSPTFQWQLNGSNVGTGTASYSNPNLVDGDIITCNVSPDFSGCSTQSFVTNRIRIIGPTAETTWTGALNNNWSLDGNWTFGIPNQFVSAIIPASPPNQPVLTATSEVNDVELQVGSSLGLSNQSLLVNGDFTIDGTLNAQTGTVSFTGIGEATISGNTVTFYRLAVNKTNLGEGVTLATPIRIQNETVFVSGNIRATAHEIVFENDADSRVGLDISYIEGTVRKIGDDEFTFPLGGNGMYAPIGISAPSNATDEFVASYSNANATDSGFDTQNRDPALLTLSECEYWILNREIGSSAVFVSLGYEDVRSCGTSEPNELRVARWDGTTWQDHGYGSHSGDALSGSVTSGEAITNFSPFTLGSGSFNNPLPIELISFDATARNKDVLVSWITATEVNNDFYTIERSIDGVTFESIGIVPAGEASRYGHYYDFVDSNPIPGTSYYRLRQTDFNGQFEVFPSVSVNFSSPIDLTVYPNPATDQVLIQTKDENRKEVRIYNYSGQLVMSFISSSTLIDVDISSLPHGAYIVEVTNFSQKESRKLIVK